MIRALFQRLAAPFTRRSARARSLGMFFATSLVQRGASTACQIIQVPVILHAFGNEGFGLWMTLTSFNFLLNFTDLGIGTGVQNRLAEAFTRKDFALARELLASALVALAVIATALFAVLLTLTWSLDFGRVLGLGDQAIRAQARGAVLATVVCFCAGFPSGLAVRLANSLQLGWIYNVRMVASNVTALGLIVLGTQLHWTLGSLILATSGTHVAFDVVLFGQLLRRLGWQDLRGFRPRVAGLRGVMQLGAHFGLQQIATTILFSLPSIIVSTTLGAAAVTPFNLAQRLFNFFGIIQNAFMMPLWPAYTEAAARRELGWIRRTLAQSVMATAVFTVLPMLLGAIFARPILALWAGPGALLPESDLVVALFVWNALVFLQQPFGYLLSGVSEVRRSTRYSLATTVTCVALMSVLVHTHAQTGVVFGLIAGFVPFNFAGNVLEVFRFLRAAARDWAGPTAPGRETTVEPPLVANA